MIKGVVNMEVIDQKIKEYFNWLKDSYKYKQLENSTEITTPFRNHINDLIRIYIDVLPNKELVLSDDGITLSELEMYGIDIDTSTRKKLIEDTLQQFNLELQDDQIISNVKNNSFPQSKHNLIQGILKLYDLTLTSKVNATNIFYEEVYDFLNKEEIIGTPEASVSGESGITYTMDYILPSTRTKPEILLNFVNNLDFNKITSDSFVFNDVKEIRSKNNKNQTGSEMFIIANDVDNNISSKVYKAADSQNIGILKWSNKENITSTLKKEQVQ